MNHYETLGVPPSATAEEIKLAWRRKASENHPDREDGDAEVMAAVNRAYEVLGDPERRAEYDRTGTDAAPGSLEQEARNMLMQLFQSALDNTEAVLSDVSVMLTEHQRRLVQAHSEHMAKRSRLVKRTGRIKVKKGENLVQLLIDQQIRHIDQMLPQLERGQLVNARCVEMLQDYVQETQPAAPQPQTVQYLGQQQQALGNFPWGS